MDVEAIRLFTVVAREGSLQKAAEASGVSRMTLRRKLDALEDEMGVRLARRTRHGVELTESGLVLVRHASEAFEGLDLAVRTAREVTLELARPIRMSVPAGMPPIAHQVLFQTAREIWPGARLDFQIESADSRHEFDIRLSLSASVPDGPYEVQRLGEFTLRLFASHAWLAEHPVESPEALADFPLLVWTAPGAGAPDSLPRRGRPPVPITPALTSNDPHLLHELVELGTGIGWGPHGDIGADADRKFVTLWPDEIGESLPFYLLVSHVVGSSPRVRMMISIITKLVQGLGLGE